MKARGTSLGAAFGLALVLFVWPPFAAGQLADLQTRFDRESDSVRKAKLLQKLGETHDELLKLLFPNRPLNQKAKNPPPPEKQP